MYFLSVVAIFKNESHILKEWLSHQVNEGVDHFYLINNGSTDDFRPQLQPFIDSKHVTLFEDETKWAQVQLYNKYVLPRKSESVWFMIIDLDEFVYARKGINSIKSYLKTKKSFVGMVRIPWKMFGSSGFIAQPSTVTESFLRRSEYNGKKKPGMKNDRLDLNKVIVRSSAIRKIKNHYAKIKPWYLVEDATGRVLRKRKNHIKVTEKILEDSFLHLNHYAIQSWDWFMKVKCTRGAANTARHEYVRDENYFRSYDSQSNDIEDLELSRKKHGK